MNMKKPSFTREVLTDIYDRHGMVTLGLVADQLPSWRLDDIKARLNQLRYREFINYDMVNGEMVNFSFNKVTQEEKEAVSEGQKVKAEDYYKQVRAMDDIIYKAGATDTNRIKAAQIQQYAMDRIPEKLYLELKEIYG